MKTKRSNLRIFVGLGGLNPQILTEGLFYLSVIMKISFDKIFILTTNECRKNIETNLKRELKRMAERYSLRLPKFDSNNIYSVDEEFSTDGKGNKFSELVFSVVRELTSDDRNVLYCLISGGRKTMSVDLAIAMTLFARNHDKIYHILADKEFEASRLYFPETIQEAKKLTLIEKPFVKLRQKFLSELPNEGIGYKEIIDFFQGEIDKSLKLLPLVIDQTKRTISIGERTLELPPLQFAIYLFFAMQNKFVLGGKNFSRSSSEKLWKIYRRVSSSYGHLERVRKFGYQNGLFDFEVIQKAISQIRRKIKTILNNDPLSEYYVIAVEGSYGKKMYGIKLPRELVTIIKGKSEYERTKI